MRTHFAVRKTLFALLLIGGMTAVGEGIDEPLERLAKVNTFAFGGVGYAGVTSKGELDFKIVLARPRASALAAFEKLYSSGNAQARAYALSGIRKLDQARFKELLGTARTSTDQVEVMRGCIVSRESFGGIAKEIDAGDFDLDNKQPKSKRK